MSCTACHSANQREFTAEGNIHFPGIKGFDIPTVLVFPEIRVCMDCGLAEFTIPDAQLKRLNNTIGAGRADSTTAQL